MAKTEESGEREKRMTEWMLNEKWRGCPMSVVKVYPVTLASVTQRAIAVMAPGVTFCVRPTLRTEEHVETFVERLFCGRVKPDDVDQALETALLASGSNFKPNRTERHE